VLQDQVEDAIHAVHQGRACLPLAPVELLGPDGCQHLADVLGLYRLHLHAPELRLDVRPPLLAIDVGRPF
jgi:hypothetical protein